MDQILFVFFIDNHINDFSSFFFFFFQKRIFQVVTAGSENYVNDIKKIISQIIHPAVQIQYSAAGRVCKGLSKRKYISTSSYKCMIGK